MADTKTTVTPVVTPTVVTPAKVALPTKDQLIAKLTTARKLAEEQAGSPFFNPFVWAKKNITPLLTKLKAKDTVVTPEMVAAADAIRVPTSTENKAAFEKSRAAAE